MSRAISSTLLGCCLALLLAGCGSTPPQPDGTDYRARAQQKVDGRVRVSASVLSDREAAAQFPVPLARRQVQPVWIEIENREDRRFVVMLLSIDPDYFSPSELAWRFRPPEDLTHDGLMDLFLRAQLPVVVPPGSTVSGFVYTNTDPGAKAFAVDLVGEGDMRSFEFVQLVPGFEADFMTVDFDRLYPPDAVRDLDLPGLRAYLEALPCCVSGDDGQSPGDPLNLVIVGDGRHVLATLKRRGWDLTETVRTGTVWRTVASSMFGSYYRTSPVSPLYLFGRPHDVALQKARSTVNERNHLRLWLAPASLRGQQVWIGQITRDIGIKLSGKTFVTHRIDPVVDEARFYITQDVAASEALRAFGYVEGVGYSGRAEPRYNYTADPYYTDGLRVVLILDEGRRPLDSVERLGWARPLTTGSRPEEAAPTVDP